MTRHSVVLGKPDLTQQRLEVGLRCDTLCYFEHVDKSVSTGACASVSV